MLSLPLAPERGARLLLAAVRMAGYPETHIHTAADKHVDPIKQVVARAFTEARAAYKHGGLDSAVSTLRASLTERLPRVLLAALTDGGHAAVAALPRRKTAGDVEGHEFHGNQWTDVVAALPNHPDSKLSADASKVFAEVVHTFPDKGQQKRPYNGNQLAAALKKQAPPKTEVEVKSLIATQAILDRKPLLAYLNDPSKPSQSKRDVIVASFKDRLYIADGHHRVAAALLRGDTKISARVVKMDHAPTIKALKEFRTAANFDLQFNASDPVAAKWAREHAAELATSLSDTTRQAIRDAVAQQQETGDDSYDEILAAVGDETRAELIARTESMRASNEGQREAWDQAVEAGLLPDDARRVWIAAGDPCPECEDLDGEEADLGEEYPKDGGDGPPLHPNSIIAGVVVQGDTIAVTRMSYAGQVREFVTAGGRQVTVTPNHAVATIRGFILARDVQEGDHLLAYEPRVEQRREDARTPSVNSDASFALPQDEKHGPSAIEQVFGALLLEGKPIISERLGNEFHGDAQYGDGDIDVVYADVELRNWIEAALVEQRERLDFKTSNLSAAGFGSALLGEDVLVMSKRSAVPTSRSLASGTRTRCIGETSELDAAVLETITETPSRDAYFCRQLVERLTGDVTLDEVVEVRNRDYFGHVYDLNTVSGVIVANSLIISNCRCTEGIVGF